LSYTSRLIYNAARAAAPRSITGRYIGPAVAAAPVKWVGEALVTFAAGGTVVPVGTMEYVTEEELAGPGTVE